MGKVVFSLPTSSQPEDRERDCREDGRYETARRHVGRSVAVVGLAVAFEVVAFPLHGAVAF